MIAELNRIELRCQKLSFAFFIVMEQKHRLLDPIGESAYNPAQ